MENERNETMASRIELTQQYMSHQQNRQTDEMLAMLADDVTMSSPMSGIVTGKEALAQQMKSRPAGGGAMGDITWSDPEEDGDEVKVIGTGSPFGPIKIVLTYNADDQINKIEAGLA